MVFEVIDFLQTANKRIWLYYYDTSGQLVFVRFLEEIDDTKKPFRNNWPLRAYCPNIYLWMCCKILSFLQSCLKQNDKETWRKSLQRPQSPFTNSLWPEILISVQNYWYFVTLVSLITMDVEINVEGLQKLQNQ